MFRKEPLNPTVSMKPLYWTRIIVPVTVPTIVVPEIPKSINTSGTPLPLWEQLEEAKIEDMDAFTSLFSRQVIERKPTKKKTEKPSKQQVSLFFYTHFKSIACFEGIIFNYSFCFILFFIFPGCQNSGQQTVSKYWHSCFKLAQGFF